MLRFASMRLPMLALLAAVGAVALALPAAAVDGVLEINHTCASQTGCFAGDSAGYPVTITGRGEGSYRLTTSLVVPDENTHGIEVTAPRVTIDLNGFEIVRAGCAGTSTDCTPASGTGSGVIDPQGLRSGIVVKNGTITGMGVRGVSLGSFSTVSDLRVRWCRVQGIFTLDASSIERNVVWDNNDVGILVLSSSGSPGSGSRILDNIVIDNGDVGISVNDGGSIVRGNTARGNAQDGIYADRASVIDANVARGNGAFGIIGGTGSTVTRNAVDSNAGGGIFANGGSVVTDNALQANAGDGIYAASGSTVARNSALANTGYGLNLAATAAYRENVVTNNTAGTVNSGVDAGGNVCNGAATCP